MNKKSILERLQQKDIPKDREIIQVRVFRPNNIAITEALPDKDFSPADFRNKLSDRNYQPQTDVNVSIFKKIISGPKIINKSIKKKIIEITDDEKKEEKPKKPKKKVLKPEDEIVFKQYIWKILKLKVMVAYL